MISFRVNGRLFETEARGAKEIAEVLDAALLMEGAKAPCVPKKQLVLYDIDGFDRAVFKDDDGNKYACVFPLWDWDREKQVLERYVCNLHTVTEQGEPDMPVDCGSFELKPYVWLA